MTNHRDQKPAYVIGPVGEKLTVDALPDPHGRWTTRRKGEIVAAVQGGLLTLAEIENRYNISLEEYATWARTFDRSGLNGLRVTHAQYYRTVMEREQQDKSHRPHGGRHTPEPACFK